MVSFLFGALRRGIEKIRGNPQLLYTILVAAVIVGAFLFMTERFVRIATDAQERLVNVRVGALQDAFVSFAGERITEPQYLEGKIQEIIASNETIRDFSVIEHASSTTATSTRSFHVIASAHLHEPDASLDSAGFLYSLATSDPTHSITIQLQKNGEREFQTARAITSNTGEVIAVVMTTQTLSQADRAIENDIQSSILLLIGILVVIMLLFLRFSKVIDYMALYKKLREVDQLKDDFISMASHELRTPLTVIRGYTEYITSAKELLPETKKYAAMIDTSAKGLDALVADILDVSRMEQGRMSFTFATINPTPLITEVVQSFEMPAKEKGLELSLDTTIPPETTITVDHDRLKQVLVNIIGNAIKYTLHGSVKIRTYLEKGRVVVRVSDTGFGMSEEERAHLFEKFYRIKTEDTKDIRGTGLGLWITAQIVKEMKGGIAVESIKGVGSHFVLSFPQSG